jgi:hypothetical protein
MDARLHEPTDHAGRGLEARVEVDRAQQGLKRIRQSGASGLPAGSQLAGAEREVVTEIQPPRDLRERLFPDQGGPEPAQLTLVCLGESGVKGLGDDEPEQCVSEEFEPFVVIGARASMSEGALRQVPVGEAVIDGQKQPLRGSLQRATSSTLSPKETTMSMLPNIGFLTS